VKKELPVELLARLLSQAPISDPAVLLKPAPGLDCAVVDYGPNLLVFKSDPITFVTDEIGWYLVQVTCNDLATCGAQPRWMLVTALFPGEKTTPILVDHIADQLFSACREEGISVIGGHTEITHGLDRPILVGTLIGEVSREKLVTPRGAKPGDLILLTKSIPIEATAIIARELPDKLAGILSADELAQAREYIRKPGIGISKEAQIAISSGRVNAMHDPTEGGLTAALWELADACSCSLIVNLGEVPITDLSKRMCAVVGIDPYAAIASGALLLTASASEAEKIRSAIQAQEIECHLIGRVVDGAPAVWNETSGGLKPLPRPARDEIARLFEEAGRTM